MRPLDKRPVCCGERLNSDATVARFSEIRELLVQRRSRGFEPVGQFYKVGLLPLAWCLRNPRANGGIGHAEAALR